MFYGISKLSVEGNKKCSLRGDATATSNVLVNSFYFSLIINI